MGEDAFLEAQYEDRFVIEEEDLEETAATCTVCELAVEDCECEFCTRCDNNLSDGVHHDPEGEKVCWVCADRLPEPEDYILSPGGYLGSETHLSEAGRGFLKAFPTTEDALEHVGRLMKSQGFYPSLWWQSDHGNLWPIDLEGNEIK